MMTSQMNTMKHATSHYLGIQGYDKFCQKRNAYDVMSYKLQSVKCYICVGTIYLEHNKKNICWEYDNPPPLLIDSLTSVKIR